MIQHQYILWKILCSGNWYPLCKIPFMTNNVFPIQTVFLLSAQRGNIPFNRQNIFGAIFAIKSHNINQSIVTTVDQDITFMIILRGWWGAINKSYNPLSEYFSYLVPMPCIPYNQGKNSLRISEICLLTQKSLNFENIRIKTPGSSSKGHFWQNQHVVSWSRGDR